MYQSRTQSEMMYVSAKTSRKLRRPSPSVATKPLTQGCASPLLEHHPSRIVPPSVTITHKRAESSSVSPPSTPRSADSQARPASARGDLVRRPFNRGQQQQRKQLAPSADSDTTITASQIGDGLLVPGVRKPCPRRVLAPTDGSSSVSGSPNLSSGSSLSLLSTGSEVDAPTATGSSAPESTTSLQSRTSPVAGTEARSVQHKQSTTSSVTARVGKFNELTIPAHADHANY